MNRTRRRKGDLDEGHRRGGGRTLPGSPLPFHSNQSKKSAIDIPCHLVIPLDLRQLDGEVGTSKGENGGRNNQASSNGDILEEGGSGAPDTENPHSAPPEGPGEAVPEVIEPSHRKGPVVPVVKIERGVDQGHGDESGGNGQVVQNRDESGRRDMNRVEYSEDVPSPAMQRELKGNSLSGLGHRRGLPGGVTTGDPTSVSKCQ